MFNYLTFLYFSGYLENQLPLLGRPPGRQLGHPRVRPLAFCTARLPDRRSRYTSTMEGARGPPPLPVDGVVR